MIIALLTMLKLITWQWVYHTRKCFWQQIISASYGMIFNGNANWIEECICYNVYVNMKKHLQSGSLVVGAFEYAFPEVVSNPTLPLKLKWVGASCDLKRLTFSQGQVDGLFQIVLSSGTLKVDFQKMHFVLTASVLAASRLSFRPAVVLCRLVLPKRRSSPHD